MKRRNDGDGRAPQRYVLRLYVTGQTPRSVKSIENLKRFCESHLKDRYEMEVIDIYQQSAQASENQIMAAPTLIKRLSLPLPDWSGIFRIKTGSCQGWI